MKKSMNRIATLALRFAVTAQTSKLRLAVWFSLLTLGCGAKETRAAASPTS